MSQTTQAREVFQQWVERYRDKPALFVQEVLGVDPDVWQIEHLPRLGGLTHRLPHNFDAVLTPESIFSILPSGYLR